MLATPVGYLSSFRILLLFFVSEDNPISHKKFIKR